MVELIPFGFVVLYFVPFMVAATRNHDATTGILIANVLVGWTFIGWFLVLFAAIATPSRGALHYTPPPKRQLPSVTRPRTLYRQFEGPDSDAAR